VLSLILEYGDGVAVGYANYLAMDDGLGCGDGYKGQKDYEDD
jgi:hypothetical protein